MYMMPIGENGRSKTQTNKLVEKYDANTQMKMRERERERERERYLNLSKVISYQ
jgi:hypothetical protein